MVVDYIREHAEAFGVEPIVEVLSEHGVTIATSTDCAHAARAFGPTGVEVADAAHDLYRLWVNNRRLYGQHKLWKAARRAGIARGRDQVARLMGICGIAGAVRGRRTTVTTRRGNDPAARHPDHINRAWDQATRPDQWWVADFTYVWTLAGFVYVSFVTDVFSRKVLGWRTPAESITSNYRPHHKPVLLRPPEPAQYTSIAFTEALTDARITGSVGSVG